MKIRKEGKNILAWIVVLAMIFQIVAPGVADYVYADKGGVFDKDLVLDVSVKEDKATINWDITFQSNDASNFYRSEVDFVLDEEAKGSLEAGNGESIGNYTISTDGEVLFEIDESFYSKSEEGETLPDLDLDNDNGSHKDGKNNDVQDPEGENPEEPEVGEDGSSEENSAYGEDENLDQDTQDSENKNPEEDEDYEEDKSSSEDEDDTLKPEEDTVVEDQANIKKVLSKSFIVAASVVDVNNPILKEDSTKEKNKEEIKEEIKTYNFKGSFEVNNVVNRKFALFAEGIDLGNIFTFESLKVNGTEADENQVVTIGDGTTVRLEYKWDTVGLTVNPGDWSEIEVPDAFKLNTDFENLDIKLSDGTVVGKYSLIDNKLRFVFGEGIVGIGEVENGELGFGVEFNEEKFQQDVVEEIEFNDKSDKTITIIGKPSGEISSINKLGTPDSDKDAKTITWVVDVANPSDTAITDAKLKDKLPEGLELELDTVKVNNLNIGLNGDLSLGSEVTGLSPQVNGQNFELDLPTVAPYKGYRIEYTTTIIDKSITQFTNKASFEYGDNNLPADTTVSIERSADIEKDGKYLGNDEIDWWIDVNKSGGSIENAKVEDALPAGVTLVLGSIEILKLTQNGDNWTESNSGKTANEFPVTLGQIDDAYRIKFKTSIDYSNVNEGEYKKDNSFTNKTILKNGEEEIGDAEKTVEFSRDPILSKTGKQNVDYQNKEIKWTVTVNKANHPIDNAIVTDILPAGLTISESDIVIKNSEDEVVTDKTITVPDNDGTAPTTITIDLGDINEKYTIEYTTKITDFNIDEFLNGASLEGTGVGPGITIKPVPVKPAKNSYAKSYKGIDYNEKTISWETVANPTREAFKTFKITDTFPNYGLMLLPDTLEVKIGGQVKTLDTDYTLTAIDGNYNNGFVVEFIGGALPINARILMTYKTSYDPEKDIKPNTGNGLYKNQAKFEGKTVNDNPINITRNAEKKVNEETVNTGKKVGKLISKDAEGNIVNGWVSGNERRIRWEVYINYKKQNIGSHVSIEDVLNYDGEVDIDSIEVRKYNVATNGNTTLGNIVDTTNYSVTPGENNKGFTLSFNSAVTERYAIVFTTSVPNISQKTYTNTAKTQTENGKYPYTGSVGFDKANNNLSKKSLNTGDKVYTDDEVSWNIKINEALSKIEKDVKIVDTISSGLVYKSGSLKVYKLEGTQKTELSDGYTLDVITNSDGETILTIVFDNSISSAYEIEYTTIVTATDGTVNNKVDFSGKNLEIKSVETEKLDAEQFSYVGGDPAKGKIKVIKVDQDGTKITSSNATFKLFYKLNGVDQEFGEYETTNGEVEIVNLPLNRTYYLEEISAPEGYVGINEPIEIEVNKSAGNDGAGTYEREVENIKIKANIEFTKTDEGGKLLEGASFGLYENSQDEPIRVVSSDEKGIVLFEDTPYGDYTIKEISPPTGYLPYDETLYVSIGANDNGKTLNPKLGEEEKSTVINEVIKGNVKLVKKDDRDKLLEGAVFALYNSDDELIGEQITSNAVGEVIFENIPYGDYTIREISAPIGYVFSDEDILVSIKENDLVVDKGEVVNTKIEGNIEFTKKDNKGTILQGAEFSLYNKTDEDLEDAIKRVESDEDGLVRFENIPFGEYVIKETIAPVGYEPSELILSAVVEENGILVIPSYNGDPVAEVINGKIEGDLEVIKKSDTGETLKGAEFELRKEGNGKVYTMATDENGRIVFKDIEYGTYILKEIKAPKGHLLNQQTHEVEISEYKQEIIRKTIENQKNRGNIEFTKYGENNNPLKDAVFTLYKASDLEQNYPIDEATSDENGLVRFSEVPYGDYIIVESQAPQGYNLTDVVLNVSIVDQGVTVRPIFEDQIIEDGIANTKIRGNIEILKVDSKTKRGLRNATIAVYTKDGTLIGEKLTDNTGKVRFEGLEYGEYYFKETKAPLGYILNTEEYSFEVRENEQLIKRTFENTKKPEVEPKDEGRIKIVKRDSTTGELLSRAEFDIVNSRGQVVETLITDYRGIAISKYLPLGDYIIREVRAPIGYILNRNDIEVRISRDTIVEVDVFNRKDRPTDPEYPDPEDPEDPDRPPRPDRPDRPDPEDPKDPDKPDPEDPKDPDKPDPTDPTDPEDPEPEKPVVPVPPTPTDPTDPEDPEEEDVDGEHPEGGNQVDEPTKTPGDEYEDVDGGDPEGVPVPEKDKLAKTGAADNSIFYIGGLLLILAGLFIRRRKVVK